MYSVNNRLCCFAQGWACQLHASCFPSWPEWILGGPHLYPHHVVRQRSCKQTGAGKVAAWQSSVAAQDLCRAPSTRARAMPGRPEHAPVHRPCQWGRMEHELGGSGGCRRPQRRSSCPARPGLLRLVTVESWGEAELGARRCL